MFLKATREILRQTFTEWLEDKADRLGAALAFYSVLSIAPLLVIVLAIAGFVLGEDAARGRLVSQIEDMVGPDGAKAIEDMIAHAQAPQAGVIATVLGIATLLLGASGVFGQLQDALNTIWEVQPKPRRGLWGVVKDRFLSFSMVLGTGFLLLASLVMSALLEAAGEYIDRLMPGLHPMSVVLNLVFTFGVITLLFALIFKVLPDVQIRWRDVWIGAVMTAALFTAGKYLLGLYLGRASIGSAYGAAGSLVVLVVWIYYSSQILFFGAEFTQVYAKRHGSRLVPTTNAMPVTAETRAQQGLDRDRGGPGSHPQVVGT